MRSRVLTMGFLLVAAALAGCIGTDGDAVEPATTEDQNATADDGQLPDENVTLWANETVEGAVTGANAAGNALTVHDQSENTVIQFTTEPDIRQVVLNVTTDGSEVMVSINAPDCDPGDTRAGCETVSTSGGEATYRNQTPQEGTWELTVFPDEPVLVEATFEIEILHAFERPA